MIEMQSLRGALSARRDFVRDPALTASLIVQCLLIFVTSPFAAAGFRGSHLASEVLIAFAVLVVLVSRGHITVTIAVVAAIFTLPGSLLDWLAPSIAIEMLADIGSRQPRAKSPATLTGVIALGVLLPLPAVAASLPCDAVTQVGVTCACDVRTLRPLQGAIGMEEVRDKAQKIVTRPKKEWRDLVADPIKVIRGPGNELFIIDHHHGADAWQLAGRRIALCRIDSRPAFATEAEFWSGLVRDRLVRLADADGKPLTPAQLPSSLQLMPDDPYRSLAWLVRKNNGFCRSEMPQKEFAEFLWADWLRKQPQLPVDAVRGSAASELPTALTLTRSPGAQAMPGYVGTKPAGFTCPKD